MRISYTTEQKKDRRSRSKLDKASNKFAVIAKILRSETKM